MNFLPTKIAGVTIIEPLVFTDERGYFFESYNEADFKAHGINTHFVQDNQSRSSYGVIRGLHCQLGAHAQAKLIRVLEGSILDVVVDVRPLSPTFGQHLSLELSADNQRQLFIPRGFLHGFAVLSNNATIAYKCDNLYCKSSEFGVRYDDPTLAIDWHIPTEQAIISDKDRAAASFAHFKELNLDVGHEIAAADTTAIEHSRT